MDKPNSGFAESQEIYGHPIVEHIRDGEIIDVRYGPNLIVNAGKAAIASRINGSGGEAAFTFVAIGIGAVAAAATDALLGSEIATGGGARAAATVSRVTSASPAVTNDTAQLELTYTFSLPFAVTETGVFNATSAGTMLARRVFSALNVVDGDSLKITWKITAT